MFWVEMEVGARLLAEVAVGKKVLYFVDRRLRGSLVSGEIENSLVV